MDPQPPADANQPNQPEVPQPLPAPSAVPTPTPPSVQPTSMPLKASRSPFKIVMIALAVLVLLAIIGGVGPSAVKKLTAAKPASKSAGNIATVTQNSSTPKSTTSEAAGSLDDFGDVCGGKSISNAAADAGAAPHTIQLFSPSLVTGDYVTSAVVLPITWQASYQSFTTTELVGCLSRKSASAQPATTCNLESNSKPVSVGLYTATYNLAVYAAKTGKKLGTAPVTGSSTACPYLATYDASNPKIYADPDTAAIQAALRPYVTSQ